MEKTFERIAGDTEGVAYEFPVYRFAGDAPEAPRAYLQAALHAGELPGTVALHALMPRLRQAEAEGRIRGALTVVPWANPLGRAQYLFGEIEGRFHLGTRTNFNRDFPLLDRPDASLLAAGDGPATTDRRLKERLLSLSLGHDIVLDLHCDDESLAYLYVPSVLWPAMADCAAAMGVDAVLLWEGYSDAAFEEAAIHPYLAQPAEIARFERRVVSTVEYRGISDVDAGLAEEDAQGLYRLLVGRGVIEDGRLSPPPAFAGLVAPLRNVEMVRAPRAGAILFHVRPGDRVAAGDRLATIVHAPGEPDGTSDILAPQAGTVLTRRAHRSTRAGDDLLKLIGEGPSATARPGALEE
jgi:predicted deacylase